MTAQQKILDDLGVTYSCVAKAKRNDGLRDDWDNAHHWAYTLQRGDAIIEGMFSKGYAIQGDPTREEVMECLLIDTDHLDLGDFEEWADWLGFDPDSRRAERIYHACLQMQEDLQAMFSDEELENIRNVFEWE